MNFEFILCGARGARRERVRNIFHKSQDNREEHMDEFGKILNSHTVEHRRLLPGSRERVFEYLSNPELISIWLMKADVEQKLGGRVTLKSEAISASEIKGEHHEVHECYTRGIIHEYEPPKLISYSWNELTYNVATFVKFELLEEGDQVRLILTHSRLPGDMMASVAAGWHTHIDTLIALLNGEEKPDFLPRFNKILDQYRTLVIAAGIVAASSAAPAAMASDLSDGSYNLIKSQRAQLLSQYDRVWKDVDSLKRQLSDQEHSPHQDANKASLLNHEIAKRYAELKSIDTLLADMEKVLR